jgi:hypothetical protein
MSRTHSIGPLDFAETAEIEAVASSVSKIIRTNIFFFISKSLSKMDKQTYFFTKRRSLSEDLPVFFDITSLLGYPQGQHRI